MALEASFSGLVTAAFGPVDSLKVIEWLISESILASEDFGMLASEEREVESSIIAPAKTKAVHADALRHKIAFKKLWKLCRTEQDQGNGLADPVESESGLCEKARKSCEAAWVQKHGYALAPGRRLVSTQLAPMHSMSHVVSPNPRDFSLLPVRRMKLQDGSLGAHASDEEMASSIQIYVKLRAFFYSYAFVNMDQTDFFSLGAAEAVNDKLLTFLFAAHPQGRPPVTFYAEAWESTARVFQLGVRAGKPLCDLTDADSSWQHFWTAFTPAPRPALADPGKGQKGDKGNGKGGKSGKDDHMRQMQQKKDKQIAQLKRELETARAGGPKGGQWKAQKRW